MKDKHNLPAHLAISEALSRELPIDPELRDIILLAEETMHRFDHYWAACDEDNTPAPLCMLIDKTGRNIIGVVEDLMSILSGIALTTIYERRS